MSLGVSYPSNFGMNDCKYDIVTPGIWTMRIWISIRSLLSLSVILGWSVIAHLLTYIAIILTGTETLSKFLKVHVEVQ